MKDKPAILMRAALLALTCSIGFAPLVATPQVLIVNLEPETSRAFDAYVSQTEGQMTQALQLAPASLWPRNPAPENADADIKVERIARQAVEGGLIHDWIGSVLIRNRSLEDVARLLTDYDNHKNIYPEVVESRLERSEGDRLTAYLRLRKKHVLTVVLDTEYDVTVDSSKSGHWTSWSRSTRIAEVSQPDSREEEPLPVGHGHGFLWRMNVYWNLVAVPGGVLAECRSVSLSRGIPFGLGWVLGPISSELPRDSLEGVLRATREFVENRQ